jgi:outer membrane protein OmpA-like peptidoglycan-associated protein
LKNLRTLGLVCNDMHRILLTILFYFISYPTFAQRETDTFRLYFDLGMPQLNHVTEKKIDLLIYNDKIINGSNIMVIGYTDYLGTEGFNKNLSMKRAENVKDYLEKYGINAKDIKLCVGRGEVTRTGTKTKEGFPADRRVDIVVNNKTKKKPAEPTKTIAKNEKMPLANMEEMKQLKPGSVFLLKNVYFPADRHIIKPESIETLEKLYTVMRDNPRLKIAIEGHVCCISVDADDALDIDTYEPSLSVNRAKAIYNFLVGKGIESNRLKYEGFGKRRPVVPYERNEKHAEKNRRVEIRIIENK